MTREAPVIFIVLGVLMSAVAGFIYAIADGGTGFLIAGSALAAIGGILTFVASVAAGVECGMRRVQTRR